MRSKYKIIIVGISLILIIAFSMFIFLMPKITIDIHGPKYITIIMGEEYIEEGANAHLQKLFQKEELEVKVAGNVNPSKIGKYIITYKAKTKWLQKEVVRIVNVIDNISPVITLTSEVKLCRKNNLIEINATATDNYDGDLSDKIQYNINDDNVYITVTDSSNNKTKITKKIKYIDNEKPTITLKGESVLYLNVGDEYKELGATAYDSCDGNITKNIQIEGKVDSNVPNTYHVYYKVKDSVGNEKKIYRTIIVGEENIIEYPVVNGATIYLTFDDGPGKYTEQILSVLDNYDVKATFFVTNQFPKYQNLIKKEYESGHTIGIHTYSHKWSIYESVDSYLADYKKIEDIVYDSIGIRPKIFRFPGGSSNTVSRNYSEGIMTTLTQLMTDNGYVYFDWTFDSGDTNKKDNSVKAIINNVKKNLKGDGNYIILMHDIKKNTLEALPEIIEYAKSLGYAFSALDENSPTVHLKVLN